MLRSEVELVKRLIGQSVQPANETIDKRISELEGKIEQMAGQISDLKKQINVSLPLKGTQRSKDK